jgi:hypothetical protein
MNHNLSAEKRCCQNDWQSDISSFTEDDIDTMYKKMIE